MRTIHMDFHALAPDAYAALLKLDAYAGSLGLDAALLEMVKVRSSQLNGCAFCTDMHSADALKAGVSQRQLLALTVWREASNLFTTREQAVLAFAEAGTLLPGGVSDERIHQMREHFSDTEIAHWTMAVIAINAWNRFGVIAGLVPS